MLKQFLNVKFVINLSVLASHLKMAHASIAVNQMDLRSLVINAIVLLQSTLAYQIKTNALLALNFSRAAHHAMSPQLSSLEVGKSNLKMETI